MRNITFSAEASTIDAARAQARDENTTLNDQFRIWLESYAQRRRSASSAMELLTEMHKYVRTGGRKFTRDEMNER